MARTINGTALREIRELVGISQGELGGRCGVDQSAISHLERGKNRATPELMRKLADQLGVSLDSISYPVAVPEPVVSAPEAVRA